MNWCCLLVAVVCLNSVVDAQEWGWGRCPEPDTKEDFDIRQYVGTWYEILRYEFVIFEVGTKCTTATYALRSDNSSVTVYNRGVYKWGRGRVSDAQGFATVPDPSEPAKLRVSFPDSNPFDNGEGDGEANYWVVDTDYVTYTIIYSCSDYWFFHSDILWVLAREAEISDELKEELLQKISDQGLKADRLEEMDQSCNLED